MNGRAKTVRKSGFHAVLRRCMAGLLALSLIVTGFILHEVADDTFKASFPRFQGIETREGRSAVDPVVHSRRMQHAQGYGSDEDANGIRDKNSPGGKNGAYAAEDRATGELVYAMDHFQADIGKVRALQRNWIRNHIRPADSEYNMNVTASDVTSLDREISDTRPEACGRITYDTTTLPEVSVVIPFYNEALSMLLRTVHSVLNRTPDRLLREIILVDDCSSYDYLKSPLDEYLLLLPKVKQVIRNYKREGLIRSRLKGASHAQAPVLVFLDAHTECNVGWLEPLLAEIVRRPDTVAQPFIDGIDITNLAYEKPNDIHKGAFTWDLRYVWMRVPAHVERSASLDGLPFWAAVPVGCALAVNKTYFDSIGAFDSSMDVWGGENLELGFRVWMCGGQVLTVPCSRVGHSFRIIPYSSRFDHAWFKTWQKNLMRVAEVWMEDYKQYFYKSTRVYAHRRVDLSPTELLSLQERKSLKRRLQCKSFEWYLNSVIPELPVPPKDALYHGEMTNFRSNACWEILPDGYISITYACFQHKMIVENIFTLTKDGFLTHKDKCVKFLFPTPQLKIETCPSSREDADKFGVWTMDYDDPQWGQLKVTLNNEGDIHTWCLEQVTSSVPPHSGAQMPNVAECIVGNQFQLWSFTYRFDTID